MSRKKTYHPFHSVLPYSLALLVKLQHKVTTVFILYYDLFIDYLLLVFALFLDKTNSHLVRDSTVKFTNPKEDLSQVLFGKAFLNFLLEFVYAVE